MHEAARNASTSICFMLVLLLFQCLRFCYSNLLLRCQSTFFFVFLHFSHLPCSSGVPCVGVDYLPSCPRGRTKWVFFSGFCRLLFPPAPVYSWSFIPHFLQSGDSQYFSEPAHFRRQDLAFFSFPYVPGSSIRIHREIYKDWFVDLCLSVWIFLYAARLRRASREYQISNREFSDFLRTYFCDFLNNMYS